MRPFPDPLLEVFLLFFVIFILPDRLPVGVLKLKVDGGFEGCRKGGGREEARILEGVAAGAENGKIAHGRFSKHREQKLRFSTRKKGGPTTDPGRFMTYVYANGAIFRFRRGRWARKLWGRPAECARPPGGGGVRYHQQILQIFAFCRSEKCRSEKCFADLRFLQDFAE